jgi:serine/threonine protein kinase
MPISSKLGHFNLLEEIAHGGMGTVFRAFDPTLNREVAIKVLRENLALDPKFLNDFLEEARTAAAISHPHIVQIYFVGEDAAQYYIVMELLKGQTLREIIEKEGPMAEERALDITIDVVEGLRAAYKNQMIHGDIKPANIFITEETGAKILDFGLSKLANVEVAPGEGIWGSPYYISPERVGRKAEDFRSDVYSLGATLFQTLTAHPPFEADTPEELAEKRLNEKPPLLRDLTPNITRKTEEVVNKMLNKSILLRYRDYEALLQDLKDAKTEATAKRLGVDLHPELKPPAPMRSEQAKKSLLPLVMGLLIVLLVIALAAVAVLLRQKPASAPGPSKSAPSDVKPTAPTPTTPQRPAPPPAPKPARLWNVEFSQTAPNARSVTIVGDFNNWNPTATPMRKRPNGEWVVSVQLPAGRHTYKLVVDDKWIADPENPAQVDDGKGGKNSVVVIGQ